VRKLLYWRDIINDMSLDEQYQVTIDALLNGEYKSLNLEQLNIATIAPIYSIRHSHDTRILFTTYNGSICILEPILNHDYAKSRFLRNRHCLTQFLGKIDETITATPVEELDIPVYNEPAEKKYLAFQQQFIEFSDIQEQAMTTQLPFVLHGSAGTGKTTLALSLMQNIVRQAIAPVIYLTVSPKLRDNIRNLWQEMHHDIMAGVKFLTYHDFLIEEAAINPDNLVSDRDFSTWYQTLKKCPFPEQKLYQEFRIVSGYQEEAYLALGEKQSLFAAEQRPEIFNLFSQYLRTISPGFSPELSAFSLENPNVYLIIDEAQDLSCGQLKNLLSYNSSNAVLLLGDHQVLFDGISRHPFIKQFYYEHSSCLLNLVELNTSFRCSEQVTTLANKLIELKYQVTGGASDKIESAQMTADMHDIGVINWFDASPENLQEIKDFVADTSYALINFTTEPEDSFSNFLVFSPSNIKGLEYDNIILWKPFQDNKKLNKLLTTTSAPSHNRAKAGKSNVEFLNYFNELITAVTRAKKRVIIVNPKNNSANKELIKQIKSVCTTITSLETMTALECDDNDWLQHAIELINSGHEHNALLIFTKKLHRTPAEFASFKQSLIKEPPAKSTDLNTLLQAKSPDGLHNIQSLLRCVNDDATLLQNFIRIICENSDAFKKICDLASFLITTLEDASEQPLYKILNLLTTVNQELFQYKYTLLHIACEEGNLGLIALCLHAGASPNIRAVDGVSPAHIATYKTTNSLAILQLLTAHGADLNCVALLNKTPLHFALELELNAAAEFIITQPGVNLNCKNKYFQTPLAQAVAKNNLHIFSLLLAHGADPFMELLEKKCVLVQTIIEEKLAFIRILANHGIDLNANLACGVTMAHIAAQTNKVTILAFLHERKFSLGMNSSNFLFAPIHIAIQSGQYEAVKFILEHEASPDLKNLDIFYNTTACFVAVESGKLAILQLLHEFGANFLARNFHGESLIEIAFKKNSLECFKFIVNTNKQVLIESEKNLTFAHQLATEHNPNVLPFFEFLIQSGNIDYNITDQKGNNVIMRAAKNHNIPVLRLLLNDSNLVILPDNEGNNLAHIGVIYQALNHLLPEFIAKTEHLDIINNHGYTPLHVAMYSDNIKAAETLILAGADIFITSRDENCNAFRMAKVRKCAHLLNLMRDIKSKGNIQQFQDSFIKAITDNDENLAEDYLQWGINPNALNKDGQSALHLAVTTKNLKMINLLLKNNADIDLLNINGETPLVDACKDKKPHFTTILILLSKGANFNAVTADRKQNLLCLLATHSDNLTLIERIIQTYGVDINQPDITGRSPLIYACIANIITIAELLIKHGANVNQTDQSGNIAASFALRNCNAAMLRLLIANNIDLSRHNTQLGNILHLAASLSIYESNDEIINLLLSTGMNINAKNSQGTTPVMIVMQSINNMDCLNLFLRHGASLQETNNKGETCLHIACQYSDIDFVEKTIHAGINIDAVTTEGKTPLYYACQGINIAAFNLLIKYGANPFITTYKQKTLLHKACTTDMLLLIKAVLDTQIPINAKDSENATALDYAIKKNKLLTANHLFSKGAETSLMPAYTPSNP